MQARERDAQAIESLFKQGLALHKQGRLDDAERAYLDVLARRPGHFDALSLLGVVAFQTRRWERSLDWIEKAIALKPDNAEAHNNRGIALAELQRHEDALSSFDRAITLRPDFARAHDARGNAMRELGRPLAALASFDRAIALSPDLAAAHNGRGNALRDLGRPEEALQSHDKAIALRADFAAAHCDRANALGDLRRPTEALASCDKAIALKPDLAAAHNNRGNALRDLGHAAESLASFDRAIALRPNLAEVHNNRGNALIERGNADGALASFDRAIALRPAYAPAHSNRGNALRELQRPEEALVSYDRAITLQPDLAAAHSGRGAVLQELGRIVEAADCFERAIALAPKVPRNFMLLARAVKLKPDSPHLGAMLAMAGEIDAFNDKDKIDLHFALGQALGDIGEHQRAFEHLRAGNALSRKSVSYDEAIVVGRIERTAAIFSREWLAKRIAEAEPSELPIFIVGIPRSGSTLVEQMLASHPNVYGAGEIDALIEARRSAGLFTPAKPYPDSVPNWTDRQLGGLGSDYARRLRSLAAESPTPRPIERITDKTLFNFRFLGLISRALPKARIIHMRRDPVDTCLSCFAMPFRAQVFTFDLGELGRYYRAYSRLMAHWRSALPPGAMLEVRYESLVTNFESEARRIVAFCGLSWDDSCLRFHDAVRPVRTASVVQVRQPIYQNSVRRWRPDRESLRPLLEALGDEGGS